MIAKSKRDKTQDKRPSRRKEPVDVNLTVKFNFGDEADDAITILNDVRVPMVDSVFNNRDRIVKGFVSLLLKSGLKSPAVTREIFPIVRLLKRKK
ncbi:MAG: hypothetical protein E6Q76_13335 [Rhizobium sp.]|nr:MAG: hypothetical protein E6Q76_13335 [Rhizobium sp.]